MHSQEHPARPVTPPGAPAPFYPQQQGVPPYRQGPVWTAYVPPRPAAKAAPFRVKELFATLGITATCDLALWGGGHFAAGGFGLALLLVTVPAALIATARAYRKSPRLAVLTGLLFAVAVRCAFAPTTAVALCGLGLLLAFALTIRARRVFVPEMIVSALAGIGKVPSRVAALFAGIRLVAARTTLGRVSLLPILVPLALCAVFAGVFALANPLVAHGLDVGWTAVTRVLGFPSPGRIFLWVAIVVGAASLLRPACQLATGSEDAVASSDATPTSRLVARNALGALNVLFLLYNGLDAAYLWSGAPPPGVATQQYAHQGAFWLTVALVLLTGVIGVMFRGALAQDVRAARERVLAYVWMGQGLVLALGTYRRIAMHIGNSGLSDLRIVGILGTTLVVAGVGAVALKLRDRRSFRWLVRRQLDAFAITVVLYAVFPTHLLAARVNVSRIDSGEYRPLLHMFRQSTQPESAASLVPLLHHPDLRVRQGVAALLEHEREVLRHDVDDRLTWQERDLVTGRTLRALDDAAPTIASVLGGVDRSAARQSMLEVSRVANEGRSLEELLAVPSADAWTERSSRGVYSSKP